MRYGATPYDWALEFDGLFTDRLQARDHKTITDRAGLGNMLTMAHPSVDHYLPALTIAGASNAKDDLVFMNDSIDIGSVLHAQLHLLLRSLTRVVTETWSKSWDPVQKSDAKGRFIRQVSSFRN